MRRALEPDTPAADVTFGFEAAHAKSVLESLARSVGPIPRILLPDTDPGDRDTAVVKPSSPEMPAPAERGDRYVLFGEIARGGMGAILKGRDADLGRDLAVKVLLEGHQGNADYVRRFIEEAQIGGQLQHPGIVPVYELGTFGDQRPYFTMKLVKGRTLAALLNERQGRADGQSRFLGIFEQVCQTVAYAHARGVIHRDLKPTNVMVGGFGEVQVMDWGLAKVLKEGGVADEQPAPHPVSVSVIRTVRSGSNMDESQAGSVLGTPAYMAPEQAEGDVEQVDRRADVFGLGSILCEILTGLPAYTGKKAAEVMRKAARGDTADALSRLDASGADAELITLAKDCLAAEMDQRPRDASVVAARILAHRTGVQERLRQAEITQAEETARAEEAIKRAGVERDRRRLTVALAASIIGLALLGGGGWTYLAQQRAANRLKTERLVSEKLEEATLLRGQAKTAAVGDLSKWSAAITTAGEAQSLLGVLDHSPSTRQRVAELVTLMEREKTDAEHRAAEAERDRKFIDRLEEIRLARYEGDHRSDNNYSDAYAIAFREFGVDFEKLDPTETGKLLSMRSDPTSIAFFVDDWFFALKSNAQLFDARVEGRMDYDESLKMLNHTKQSLKILREVIHIIDSDPWRRRVRDLGNDSDEKSLRAIAHDEPQLSKQSAKNLLLLGQAVLACRIFDEQDSLAETIMKKAWRLAPSDYWICAALARLSAKERVAFATAAVSLRPDNRWAREALGDARVFPYNLRPQFEYGDGKVRRARTDFSDSDANQQALDEAISDYQEAIRISPEAPHAHLSLARALFHKKTRLTEAIEAYRQGMRLEPEAEDPHVEFALFLCLNNRNNEAISEMHEAIRLDPNGFMTYHYYDILATLLYDQNQKSEAFGAFLDAYFRVPNQPGFFWFWETRLRQTAKSKDELISRLEERVHKHPDEVHVAYLLGKLGSSGSCARGASRLWF
jgi:serine/threonine-protein kinase